GLLRKNSRLANWNGHDAGLWDGLVKEAEDRKKEGLSKELPRVYGFDNDPEAVSATLENAQHAGIGHLVRVSQKNLQETRAPKSDTKPAGLVVVNPPYGERIGEKTELAGLYQDLGKTLFEHYQGYNAAILTGEKELSKAVGLRANRLNTLYNGKIRCTLSHFNIREDNQFRPYTPRFTQEQ
ncbi:MAG: 23S rRNA (guanine(2445)-N(2))/(guanine(2069)-N(7))-methyltransferase, partial [Spirochaetaceae bacterium]